MAVRIGTSNGEEFTVYESLQKLREALRDALDGNSLFEVSNGDGRVRVINPHQVVYLEEDQREQAERPGAAGLDRAEEVEPVGAEVGSDQQIA